MMKDLIKASSERIEARPYLAEIGGLFIALYETAANIDVNKSPLPDLAEFKKNIGKHTPLLEAVGFDFIDFEAAGKVFQGFAAIHENENLPKKFRDECLALNEALKSNTAMGSTFVKDIFATGGEELHKFATEKKLNADLLDFFAWMSIRRALEPFAEEFAEVQKSWTGGICPTCGNIPVMGKLKRTSRGRERFLSCGSCGTEWSYKRIGCPYCGCDNPKELEVIETEDEKDIRLDVCNKCNSYIKTYTDKGKNAAIGEDWASMHMDILCEDKKYKKCGGQFVLK